MHSASAVLVVKDGNGTACIMADFSATFLTSYDTRSGPQVGEPAPPLRLCARDGPAAVPLGAWVSCAHWGCSPTGRREPCLTPRPVCVPCHTLRCPSEAGCPVHTGAAVPQAGVSPAPAVLL